MLAGPLLPSRGLSAFHKGSKLFQGLLRFRVSV